MPTLLGTPKCQFFDTNTQRFLVGGNVYSFSAGTNTPIATYPTVADAQASTNANTNPIILDQRGECNLVLSGATKLILTDGDTNITSMLGITLIIGNIIWTVDNLTSANSDILDSNNNYLIKFTNVVGAVNYINITNAVSGSGPIIAVAGADTNIDFNIFAKGSGHIKVHNPVDITGSVTQTSGDFSTTGNISATGTLAATGNATLGGTLAVTGNVTVPTSGVGAFNLLPAGMYGWFAFNSAPTGWLICDGSAVSRTTYSALFAAIGTVYGVGDGSTTFNLPAQARKAMVGMGGSGSGTLGNTVGSTGGTETATLISNNMPAQVVLSTAGFTNQLVGAGGSFTIAAANTSFASNGSATAFSIMQPSLVGNLCIKI